MKATGIVRRIDDLGRIVIPKEIRRALRIRESDPMEIYTDREGGIVLRKYAKMRELEDFSMTYVQALQGTFGHTAAITDADAFLFVSGALKKRLQNRPLSEPLKARLFDRQILFFDDNGETPMPLTAEEEVPFLQACAVPILSNGDYVGCVMMCSDDDTHRIGVPELQALKTAALYLGKQLSD